MDNIKICKDCRRQMPSLAVWSYPMTPIAHTEVMVEISCPDCGKKVQRIGRQFSPDAYQLELIYNSSLDNTIKAWNREN